MTHAVKGLLPDLTDDHTGRAIVIGIDLIVRSLIRCPQSLSRQSMIVAKRAFTMVSEIWNVDSGAGIMQYLQQVCMFIYICFVRTVRGKGCKYKLQVMDIGSCLIDLNGLSAYVNEIWHD